MALAALSLVIPSSLTYDPYTWANWAREIVHLRLDTRAGPAWKPLPVLVDIPFAPFGAAEPLAWLVVARAGGLLAVAMAYRLARRQAGRAAGVVAAVGLLLSTSFLYYLMATGMSEPLSAGLALLALERHLDRRHGQAAALIYACVLLRPELAPFYAAYGLFMWRRRPGSRPWLIAGLVLLPIVMFLPDYLGSGDWLRSSRRAAIPSEGGPLLTAHPALAVLQSAAGAVIVPVVVGAALGTGLSLWAYVKHRRDGAAVAMVGIGAVSLLWEAVLTQAHKSAGDQRYLIVGYAAACAVAGIGWARAATVVSAMWRRHRLAGLRVAWAAIVLASSPFAWSEVGKYPADTDGMYYQVHKNGEIRNAIAEAGGRGRVLRCGPVLADTYQAAALAWYLDVPTSRITVVPPPPLGLRADQRAGTLFRTSTFGDSAVIPSTPPPGSPFRPVARTAQWEVWSAC